MLIVRDGDLHKLDLNLDVPKVIVHVEDVGQKTLTRLLLQAELIHLVGHVDHVCAVHVDHVHVGHVLVHPFPF